MSNVPDIVRRLAEEPETFITEAPPPTRKIVRPSFLVSISPVVTTSVVSAIRTTAERLDETIAEVRGLLREEGYKGCVWTVGPSSRPEGLGALLSARGFAPVARPPFEAEQTVMALASPPPAPRPGIEARLVRDYEEYLVALGICVDVFEESPEGRASWFEAAPKLWAHGGAARLTHIAYVDGRPLGFGFAVKTDAGVVLGGSGVLPGGRGRGVYRALVAARWELAVSLGTPALVIQAGAMSRPILERCGFETIGELVSYDDVSFWNEPSREPAP